MIVEAALAFEFVIVLSRAFFLPNYKYCLRNSAPDRAEQTFDFRKDDFHGSSRTWLRFSHIAWVFYLWLYSRISVWLSEVALLSAFE